MQGFGLHPSIPLACFKLLADLFINCNIWVNRNWLKWSVLKFSSHCCRWHLDIYTRLWRYVCLLRGPSQPSPAVPCHSQRASGAPNTLVWPLVARHWLFFFQDSIPHPSPFSWMCFSCLLAPAPRVVFLPGECSGVLRLLPRRSGKLEDYRFSTKN